jgi:hypothetical protein
VGDDRLPGRYLILEIGLERLPLPASTQQTGTKEAIQALNSHWISHSDADK